MPDSRFDMPLFTFLFGGTTHFPGVDDAGS
jgi:hypothetical protein